MFKYDTHVHTSETSMCGKVPAREVVRLYKDVGYDGIVITDHFSNYYFENLPVTSWADKVDMYLNGYRHALDEGNKIGLKVFLGMEILFQGSPNDYLVYGFEESFLYANPELYKLGLKGFRDFIKDLGMLIFQAHPFRHYITPADPILLDGIEIYNGNPRHDSRNHMALQFAEMNKLRKSSGSDFHQLEDLAKGGIDTVYSLKTDLDFVNLLESGSYRPIIGL